MLEQGPGSLQHCRESPSLCLSLWTRRFGSVCPRNEVASQGRSAVEVVQGPRLCRLRPWKLDVVPAPLTLEGQKASQAMFSKAGSGPWLPRLRPSTSKRSGVGGGVLPSPGPPSPSSLSLWFSLPPPSSCLLQGQEALEGASSPQGRGPLILGGWVQRTRGHYRETAPPSLMSTPPGRWDRRAGPSDPASPVPAAAASAPWQGPLLKGDGNPHPTRGLREGAREERSN